MSNYDGYNGQTGNSDDAPRNEPIVLPDETCQWFALCGNKATTTEPHPVLGAVPICDRCKAKVTQIHRDSARTR